MKYALLFLLISISTFTWADTVKKWVDDKGVVHYGDSKASDNVPGAETVKIKDTFDEKSYQEGLKRHEETEKIAKQLEKERLAEEAAKQEEEDIRNASKRSVPDDGIAGRPARRSRDRAKTPGEPVNLPANPATR